MEVDPTEYHLAEDTDEGTVDLVMDMVNGLADLPYETMKIKCGDVEKAHCY